MRAGRKWKLYSGVFIVLKKRLRFTARRWKGIFSDALALLRRRLLPPHPVVVSDLMAEGQSGHPESA